MAADDLSIGESILLLLISGALIYCIYLYARLHEKNMAKKEAAIHENIRRAENGALAGLDNDFTILNQTQLMDTRSRDGVEKFVQIDFSGDVFVNFKGIHYVGANRRLSWDWNKLMEIRTYQQVDKTMIFPRVSIFFRLVVSNRQKISGFKFEGTKESEAIVREFLQKRLLIAKAKISSKTSTGGTQQKSKPSTTNITYNIHNVQDSVIQANVETKDN